MWRKMPSFGPHCPGVRNCMSMDTASSDRVVIFGGLGLSSRERLNEIWVYNMKDQTWTQAECHGDVPTPRYCCTMNVYEDKMVCFGGFGDGDRLNTVHTLNTDSMDWKFLVTNGELPEKRSHHTSCVAGHRLLVFGGLSQEGKRLNDMHVLDLQTLTWSQVEVRGHLPSPRLGHSCVMLNSNVMVVFGGYGGPEGHTKYNEINLLHFDTMMWTQPAVHGPIPPPMYAHKAVSLGDKMIVFGGDTGSGNRSLSNETWIFDLSTMRWTQVANGDEAPPPRSHFGATIVNNQFVVFGGSGKGESEKLNDLYALDLSSLDVLREIPFEMLGPELEATCEFVTKELMSTTEQGSNKEIRVTKKLIDSKVTPALSELKGQYDRVVKEKEKFIAWSEDQLAQLEEQERQFFSERQFSGKIQQSPTGRIILNVGGQFFDTTLATLTRDSSTLLAAMFSGRYPVECDPHNNSYFLDRDPSHFRYCLNFLRDNTITLPPNRGLHLELLREASYYQISALVDFLRASLRKLDVALEPFGPEAERERMKGKSKI